jgi:hypothetical protein
MISIFISHSSLDKEVARQLASDLKHYGHNIWLDEWQIKVGHCIPTAIEQGMQKAHFVILLLSNPAVESNWVDREWKMAYWDEVNTNAVVVMPVLLEDCNIPKLLQTKKYADFRKSYAIGFHELVEAINWHTEAKGLITAYERSPLAPPKLIRGSQDLLVVSCRELKVKVQRLTGKSLAINNAWVSTFHGSEGKYTVFSLRDETDYYLHCCVEQGTHLEDTILELPKGNFYGIASNDPASGCFIISEWEAMK